MNINFINKIKNYWLIITTVVSVVATVLTIYSFFQPDLAIKLFSKIAASQVKNEKNTGRVADATEQLAASVPKWFDFSVKARIIWANNVFENDIKEKPEPSFAFSFKNTTNNAIKLTEVTIENANGINTAINLPLMILARSYEDIKLSGDIHKLTSVCVIGRIHTGIWLMETRDIELIPPVEGDPTSLMGAYIFTSRTIDQSLISSSEKLSCAHQ